LRARGQENEQSRLRDDRSPRFFFHFFLKGRVELADVEDVTLLSVNRFVTPIAGVRGRGT